MIETLNFLTPERIRKLAAEFGTPLYVYSETALRHACRETLDFPAHKNITVRYALKANPHMALLKIVDECGLHFDASSEYEAARCLAAGIAPEKIQLTSQQLPAFYGYEQFDKGILYNACSLRQLEEYGKNRPGKELSIRINPGLGSGSTRKTNVGGPSSSFGIWHEQMNEAMALIEKYELKLVRIHTHIGSGTDPEVWKKVASMTLDWVTKFPAVHTVNLGGGFKVARMSHEKSTCLQETGNVVKQVFEKLRDETGRDLNLEIEPGTYIAANMGTLLAEVDDVISTGSEGYDFLKLNTGMDALTRPALYAAEHPMVAVPRNNEERKTQKYVITGHCCESGDLFTVGEGDVLTERLLTAATVGDYIAIEGAGAYAASMSLKGYNSYPFPAEVLLKEDGSNAIIRNRQTLEDLLATEIIPED